MRPGAVFYPFGHPMPYAFGGVGRYEKWGGRDDQVAEFGKGKGVDEGRVMVKVNWCLVLVKGVDGI
jgi:hypothetical protein